MTDKRKGEGREDTLLIESEGPRGEPAYQIRKNQRGLILKEAQPFVLFCFV